MGCRLQNPPAAVPRVRDVVRHRPRPRSAPQTRIQGVEIDSAMVPLSVSCGGEEWKNVTARALTVHTPVHTLSAENRDYQECSSPVWAFWGRIVERSWLRYAVQVCRGCPEVACGAYPGDTQEGRLLRGHRQLELSTLAHDLSPLDRRLPEFAAGWISMSPSPRDSPRC